MKITITGTPASGKSSIGKLLAEKLGYKHFSMGDFQREIAREKGLTIAELGELEAKDKSYDLLVDEKQKQIGRDNPDFVMDSRLGALFVPDAVHIFIDASANIRAERRLGQKRDEEQFDDLVEALEAMDARERVNQKRWKEYYDFDFLNLSNYDFILDTTSIDVEESAEEIRRFLEAMM